MNNQSKVKPFLNVNEVAELLQCNPQAVRNLHKQGAFRGRKVGKKLLIDRESVKEYVLSGEPEVSKPLIDISEPL